MRRLLKLLVSIQVGLLVAVIGVAAPAQADTSCENPHCYSIAEFDHGGITGVAANIQRDNTTIGNGYGDPGAHINSEFWFTLDNGNYLEEGLRNGDDSGSTSGSCGCVAYDQFWADHVVSGSGDTEWRHIVAHVTPNGAWDSWNMLWGNGSGVWNIGLNGNNVGVSTVTGDHTGYFLQMGGEYQNTTCVTGAGYAANFDMYANTYYNGAWNPPAWSGTQVDPNCGFEGVTYKTGEWSWQKHAP